MYIFRRMLSIGMHNRKWPSKFHRMVAENSLLCNSRITNADELRRCCKIICDIPTSQIKKVTILDLASMGIPFVIGNAS